MRATSGRSASPARASSCRCSRASCATAARPAAVVEERVEGIAVLVWLGAADEERLRAASKAGVPIVARHATRRRCPTCWPSDLVRVPPGQGFPVERDRRRRSRASSARTARRSRRGCRCCAPAVCKQLIAHFAKRNALISAAIFIPGVDMPVLTLNQITARPADRARLRRGGRPERAPPSCSASSAPASVSARSRASCSISSRSPAGPSKAASPTRARRRSARRQCATSKRAQ